MRVARTWARQPGGRAPLVKRAGQESGMRQMVRVSDADCHTHRIDRPNGMSMRTAGQGQRGRLAPIRPAGTGISSSHTPDAHLPSVVDGLAT